MMVTTTTDIQMIIIQISEIIWVFYFLIGWLYNFG